MSQAQIVTHFGWLHHKYFNACSNLQVFSVIAEPKLNFAALYICMLQTPLTLKSVLLRRMQQLSLLQNRDY